MKSIWSVQIQIKQFTLSPSSILYIFYNFQMYNQFTAIDQKPLPMGKIQLNPMQLPKAGKKKKKKLHSKNPYKIKKVKLLGEEAMAQKQVDGLMLLKMLHFQHPKQIITANISYKRIVSINAEHLTYFTNLVELNCSQNYLKLEDLRKLPSVQKINISHNQIRTLNLQQGGFDCLQNLNMSFNFLEPAFVPQLTLLPSLIDLDLSYNDLATLPDNLSNFSYLKKLNLQGNRFKSDQKASAFWASLATLPVIEVISVSRNQIRGIHTEKLVAGNFSTLIELDFCFNAVQNQHNLICARNFVSLKKLYITGNPFALNNQYKGLQMEVYARTGAQVIVQNTNPYYLKPMKPAKPPIRFERLVKIKPDDFHKRKNALFGIQLPREQDLFSSESSSQEQVIEQPDSQPEQPMFMTEQIQQQQKRKKQSSRAHEQSKPQISEQVNESNVKSSIADEKSIRRQKSVNSSMQSSMGSKSIQYGEFHQVAAQLLGKQTEYKKNFDIHTSYKALKKAVERAGDDM